ncbi:hypothetical protein VTL71DRAFT_10377 [Oculimacula yallundae]|uniref:Uncharacterized protein n=1 Tax=Oculimacula yallundae TaxID=86028 RepID=A0ABR4CST4_9HELO
MKLSPFLWLAIYASYATAKVQCPSTTTYLQTCCPHGLLNVLSYDQAAFLCNIFSDNCVAKYFSCCSGLKPENCAGLAGVTVVDDKPPALTTS